MSVYDFASPWVAAVILNPDGSKISLWSNEAEGATLGGPQLTDSEGSYPWVTQATVTLPSSSAVPIISVQLEPPFEDGIRFLDETFEWGRSSLQVQFGYTDGGDQIYTDPWMGTLMKPDIAISTDVSITLHGQGLGGHDSERSKGSETPASGVTVREFWKKIAKGPNQERDLEVDFTEADKDEGVKARLDAAVGQYNQAGKPDKMVYDDMANIARCEYTFALKGDKPKILVRSREITDLAKPKRVFRLYHFSEGTLGGVRTQQTAQSTEGMEYPVLSLSAPEMAMWLPAGVRGAVMREVNAESRIAETKEVDKKYAKSTKGGDKLKADSTNTGVSETTEQGKEFLPGDPAIPDADAAAATAYRDFLNAGLEIEVDTVGIPDMEPEEVIALYGAGNRFSGQNFRVFEVEHTVGSDGFTTKFTAVSNVIIADESEPAQGTPNTEEPDGSYNDGLDADAVTEIVK